MQYIWSRDSNSEDQIINLEWWDTDEEIPPVSTKTFIDYFKQNENNRMYYSVRH